MSIEQLDLLLCDTYQMDAWFPFGWKWKKELEKSSYSVWAIQELGNYVGFRLGPPGTVRTTDEIINYVKEFQKEMDGFSKLNPLTEQMFSIAKDIATNVLDVLLAMR